MFYGSPSSSHPLTTSASSSITMMLAAMIAPGVDSLLSLR